MNENGSLNLKKNSASLAAHVGTTIDKKHKGERKLLKHFYTRRFIGTTFGITKLYIFGII